MAFKLVAAFFLVGIFGANALSFQNCDSKAPIQIGSVEVKLPITIRPGARIPVKARYSNKYVASKDTLFRLHSIKVERNLFWNTYIPVPIPSKISSDIKKPIRCSDLEALSPIPLCPGELGNQQFQGSFTVPSSFKLPGIASTFGSGKYRVAADIRDASGRRVVCIEKAIVQIKL